MFFLSFFRHLIKGLSLHKNCTHYEEFITVFVSFTWEWKNFSYVKLHETWCLYFPFLFSLSVLQSFFSFPASSLFGTQQQLTHPPVKSSTLLLMNMPVFRGVAPWHTIFTSSCVIPLWDSATAHSPSSKKLNASSQEDTHFSGSCTLAYNFQVILCVAYFYSEKPPLFQRSVAQDFGGVSQIYIYIFF